MDGNGGGSGGVIRAKTLTGTGEQAIDFELDVEGR